MRIRVRKVNKLIQTLYQYGQWYEQCCWGHSIDHLETNHCTTTACVGGFTVLMEGWSLWFEPGSATTDLCRKDGRTECIFDVAREILGLSRKTANILFSANPDGWRHRKAFYRAAGPKLQARVAIKELQDLVRLGVYGKRKKKKPLADAPVIVEQQQAPAPPVEKPKIEMIIRLDEPEPALTKV